MMSQLYNLRGICYNYNCLGHSFFLAQDAVFLFDNIVKSHYLNRNRACAVNKLQRAFGLDIQSTGAVFAFVPKDQIQTERPTQMLGGESEPLERSIEMSPTDNSILSQNDSPVNIPTQEFPGGPSPRPVSDSILSLLARRDEPGRSTLFPLLAASIVASSLFGAASSAPHTSGHSGGGVCP